MASMIEMIGKMHSAKYALALRGEMSTKQFNAIRKTYDTLPSLDWLRSCGIMRLTRQETFEMPYKDGAEVRRVLMNDKNEPVPCEIRNYFEDWYAFYPNRRAVCATYVDLAYNEGRPCHLGEIEVKTFTAHRNFYTFDIDAYKRTVKQYLTYANEDKNGLANKIDKLSRKLETMRAAFVVLNSMD